MQRHEMLAALKGMIAAFDDAVTTGIRRDRTAMESWVICCALKQRIVKPLRSGIA